MYKSIFFPVILCGSLKLKEEHRLRVSENRELMRICGPMKDEVMGGWRKTAQ
jgi:hypothetical protein